MCLGKAIVNLVRLEVAAEGHRLSGIILCPTACNLHAALPLFLFLFLAAYKAAERKGRDLARLVTAGSGEDFYAGVNRSAGT